MFSVSKSQVVGLLIEAMLYGVYLVTFGACIAPRFYESHPGRLTLPFLGVPWIISFVAVALLVMSTVNLSLGLVQCMGGSLHEKVNVSLPRDWVTVVRVRLRYRWSQAHSTLTCSTDLGLESTGADCRLRICWYISLKISPQQLIELQIYRCWILYFRAWSIVVIPIIIWILDSVCLIAYIFMQALASNPEHVVHQWTTALVTGAWGSTIAINIYVTSCVCLFISDFSDLKLPLQP